MQSNCPLLGKEVSFLYARVYQALAVGLLGVYFLGQGSSGPLRWVSGEEGSYESLTQQVGSGHQLVKGGWAQPL